MEELKYFIPEIEDIRVGYECKTRSDSYRFHSSEEWEKTIVTNKNIELICAITNVRGEIRTPYLSKTDIENEGWKETDTELFFEYPENNRYYFNMDLFVKDKGWYCHIGDEQSELDYSGYIKCINEFRTICKLLKINSIYVTKYL